MSIVCWRTTARASSSRRAWSSTGGGDVAIVYAGGCKADCGGARPGERDGVDGSPQHGRCAVGLGG